VEFLIIIIQQNLPAAVLKRHIYMTKTSGKTLSKTDQIQCIQRHVAVTSTKLKQKRRKQIQWVYSLWLGVQVKKY